MEIFLRKKLFVNGKGPIRGCRIAIVGEQPGKQEVQRGEPFVGPAGSVLSECCREAGVPRNECYITNVIKDLDHPLEYYLKRDSRGRMTLHEDFTEYCALLGQELAKCTANVVVATGNVALFALTGRWGITRWRGSVLESTLVPGLKVIPTVHPATVIPPKMVYINRYLIIFDLKKALLQSSFPQVITPQYPHFLKPTFSECVSILERAEQAGLAGERLGFDIEVTNLEVSCISFAFKSGEDILSICIPFIYWGGDYFTVDQEAYLWLLIARILENPLIIKLGQNLVFDTHFLLRKYGIRAVNLDDCMIAQGITYPDFPKGLHFIASLYTDIPYYKDDGKFWIKGQSGAGAGAWEKGWQYNALDSVVCVEAFPKQLKDLEQFGNLEVYDHVRKRIQPLVYMMERGIRVNVEGMTQRIQKLEGELVEKQEALCKMAGMDLNANSSKQVMAYFYGLKGEKPYVHHKTGNPTSDDMAMKRLIRKGYEEARLILDIRGLGKTLSTYLDLTKIDSDGRLRCSYNPVGTRYSRLSSGESIFGTGMNMQNWPHWLLEFLEPDPGYIFYSFDLSQFENRVVAYVGRIPQMIQAFEEGKDVHSLTASLIFGKPVDEISDEDGSSSLGDGRHSERYWGKKANHGLNYNLGYRKFSLHCEIPESDGKFIYDRYHKMYPGVKQNYHAMVKRMLYQGRIVTNLLGRKTLFLGRLDDMTFNEAYACIPQSTCGDVIDQHGMQPLYYEPQFRPLEMLLQVHDSVGMQCPLSLPWLQQAQMLWDLKARLETPLVTPHGEKFVVPADLTIGFNLYKECGKEIKHKHWPGSVQELATRLEATANELLGKSSKDN